MSQRRRAEEKGRAEGRVEGREEDRKEVVTALFKSGKISREEIAEILGMTLEEIEAMWQEKTEMER